MALKQVMLLRLYLQQRPTLTGPFKKEQGPLGLCCRQAQKF